MRRTNKTIALLLAGALPVAGCTTTHLAGEYRTQTPAKPLSKGQVETLATGSQWPLFWGLFIPGSSSPNEELSKKLRPDEVVLDLEVHERPSIGGVLLWIITAGIISHHEIEVRGIKAVVPAEPASGGGPAPAYVQPAVRADKSVDWNEGYRDGFKERGHSVLSGDGPAKPDRSADYNDGYREGVMGK